MTTTTNKKSKQEDNLLLEAIDRFAEEYAYDMGTSKQPFHPDEFIEGIKQLIVDDQQRIIKRMRDGYCDCKDEEMEDCYHWSEFPVPMMIAIVTGKEEKGEDKQDS